MDKLIRCKELYKKLFRNSDAGARVLSEVEVEEIDSELYRLTNEISDEEYKRLRIWLDRQCKIYRRTR